jgi:succinyl-diaminopimelate desuccinylase
MLDFTNDDVSDFIEFYNRYIGMETNGSRLGCRLEDELSGETVLNVGIIDMDTKSGRITVNIRYPLSFREDEIYAGMDEACTEYNVGIVKKENKDPLYIPEDSAYIKTLMQAYTDCTGDTESRPLIIGGGTYARAFENFVAFGAKFPDGESVEHQKNEYITRDDFLKMTEIYALAIRRCTSGGPEE